MTTVIIPAHNESRVIGRLLRQLVPSDPGFGPDIIVVANGCTDDTAEVAASFGAKVRVISISVASKYQALAAGDLAAVDLPYIYVDADVELGTQDVAALTAALEQPGILAAAPERVLDLAGSAWPVRWYYDVWARLPEVRRGLFGRGVVALGARGRERVAGLPPLLADDLAASLSFAPGERAVVPGARVVVHMPRTVVDLLRRRVRAVTGVAQIQRAERAPAAAARTRVADLVAIACSGPHMVPRVALFLSVTVIAQLRARRAVTRDDYTAWPRDESSRGDGACAPVRTPSPGLTRPGP